jgi:hypothetical protein
MYLATGKSSGDECSSTYEGRHITLEESLLTHPSHTDGFVDKGDPVIFGGANGYGIGVAFNSAAAATDYIAIDTEGIWFLTVVAEDDAGNVAVDEGDEIFINLTTCVLSKIRDAATQRHFGYALGDLTSGSTGVVAVKVHWDPIEVAQIVLGQSSTPKTTDVAGFKFWELRLQNTATSGDARGIYVSLDFAGDGIAGEAIRARGIVTAEAAGTVNGLHGGLEFSGTDGLVTGLGTGIRATFIGPNFAHSGGTVCGGMSELYAGGSNTDYGGFTEHSIHRFVNDGDGTGKATADNVFSFVGLSATQLQNHSGWVAGLAKALRVVVDGSVYYIGLSNAA